MNFHMKEGRITIIKSACCIITARKMIHLRRTYQID
jgi:hypothetical protein